MAHPSQATVPTAPSPFGQCTFNTSVAGLVLTENRYQPHSRLALHRHEEPYLCIVLGGAYEETTRSRRFDLRAGAVLGHAAHSEHANRFSGQGARCLNVTPTDAWRGHAAWEELQRAVALGARTAPHDAFLRLRGELSHGAQASELGVAAALFDLLHRAGEPVQAGAPPAWLRRLRDRLATSLAAPGLDELARDAGVHPSHMARAFRRWQGMSIGEFVRRRRLEHALGLLRHSEMPLSELALASGYADHAHMARAVREATGQAPRAYRMAMQSRFKDACPMQERGAACG